jgi:hypothetical protein
MRFFKHLCFCILLLLFVGCATYKTKYETPPLGDNSTTKEVSHTFYLIGDAGLSPIGELNPVLKLFREKLNKANKNSTAIFLGDNIYPAGLPDKKDSTTAYRIAKSHLDAQVATLANFKGHPVFIPGNHDWYNEGLQGLERQQKYLEKKIDKKNVFLPEGGCPIEEEEISDDVLLVTIDTEWFLVNWDKHPTINVGCDIKSREAFFEEIESIIKKNRGRTTIIATHHPMFTYGSHNGLFAFKKHIYPVNETFPLPIIGSVINVLRRTSGASIEDLQNSRYTTLRKRLITLAQFSDRVIFTSGHEHTLQYIVEENTPQIVSGSGAKKGYTRLMNGSKFSTGHRGFASLEIYKDGSSKVRFFGLDKNEQEEFLFASDILPSFREINEDKYPESFPGEVEASVYTKEEVDKSGFYRTIWGDRYRSYYGTKVKVPTVRLDTLFGGLVPVRKGGGHQSKSLRLRHKSGKEYVMRALRKSAELYLQSMAFKEQYIVGDFENTYTESILSDFYTGSHPYAPFTIGPLSDALGLFHTNPVLYYVPKQPALEEFNRSFGDELYMIEEHAGDGHGNLESFGFANELKSTESMMEDLRDDEKYIIDTDLFIRARLFDMILGDWDRHTDQWRWAEFEDKEKDKIVYKPFARDRDQAFSNMGDGALMSVATRVIPGLRVMEGFNKEIRSVEGFNSSPRVFILDQAIFPETTQEEWIAQAEYIKSKLTASVIDKAFLLFPEEVRDENLEEIKRTLLARTSSITETAKKYFAILNRFAVVTGTDKDDWFEINYLNNTEIEVKGYRIIDGEKEKLFFEKIFYEGSTKEIWVYGLDDDDHFEVYGEFRNRIKVRLIGGQNNDIYDIKNGHNISIYDFRSKKNTYKSTQGAKINKTDEYNINTYLPLKIKGNTNQLIPTLGFNPDDGFKIGFSDLYVFNGFRQNPFTQRHKISAAYYFATSGFDLGYTGEFANITDKWNFQIQGRFTSPNYSINFFGFGNESVNLDDTLELDYNRVRLRSLYAIPSLVWRGHLGAKFITGISYESISVEETEDRFINTLYQANGEETNNSFIGISSEYSYGNLDNTAFPTLGMSVDLTLGYKKSLTNADQGYGYFVPSLSIDHKLVPGGWLVLATKWKAHFNFGNDFEFYQGASIGGVDGLRGFRNQRFTGRTSYYQNTDLRLSLKKLKTGILPTTFGLYGGFDYGRVWLPNEASDQWHTSYGAGVFLNASDFITARAALFQSTDGPRVTFGLGFGF